MLGGVGLTATSLGVWAFSREAAKRLLPPGSDPSPPHEDKKQNGMYGGAPPYMEKLLRKQSKESFVFGRRALSAFQMIS